MERNVITFKYTRLSDDPGKARSDHTVQNSEIDIVREQFGLPPVDPSRAFTDDDRSASKANVVRHDWLAMLAAIGQVDARRNQVVVLAWAQDRLARRLGDTETLLELIDAMGGRLITYTEKEIGCARGQRDSALFKGLIGRIEADKTGLRVTSALRENATNGKRHGAVPYGWKFVGHIDPRTTRPVGHDVIDEDAAKVIRDACADVLAGGSLYGIVKGLNEAGIPAPGAGRTWRDGRAASEKWSPRKLRTILVRPANIGIREYAPASALGVVQRFPAKAPAILDETDYRRMMAILEDPSRRAPVSTVPVHLLSGIATCGVCGAGLRCQKGRRSGKDAAARKASTYRIYRCPDGSHVTRHADKLDIAAETWVLEILSREDIRAQLIRPAREEDYPAQLEAARSRLAEIEAMWEDGEITREQFSRFNVKAQARIDEIQQKASAATGSLAYGPLLTADDVEAAWAAMPLDRRRAALSALLTIQVHPTSLTGRAAALAGLDMSAIKIGLRAAS